jgi:lipopolysaccharide transport system ATP-binding protein
MDAIQITKLSKQFRKNTVRREYTTLKSELVRWIGRGQEPTALTHLTALHDISLNVRKGQTFGLVGRNGSGKSTLLKLVTGIYKPTSGSIKVEGRISALLELGAGFHPDFSGRENILINGIILGMSRREIKARMDEIIEFSELGDFVDEPVRVYSSGMYARLAFSVATHVDPEILIIDEILSVGDAHFAHKSRAKMEEFHKRGKTILLVTHDLGTLEQNCDAAAWLDGGTLRAIGNPADVVAQYRQAVAEGEAQGKPLLVSDRPSAIPLRQPSSGPPAEPGKRWGTFEMEVTNVRIEGSQSGLVFNPGSPLSIRVDYRGADTVEAPYIGIAFHRDDGQHVWSTNTAVEETGEIPLAPAGTVTLTLPRLGLGEGSYRLDVVAFARGERVCDWQRGLYGFTVKAPSGEIGLVRPVHSWSVVPATVPATGTRGPG